MISLPIILLKALSSYCTEKDYFVSKKHHENGKKDSMFSFRP